MPRAIELLSPAKNLECGIEAIRHGADAVYIGAPRFGARAAAGNSVEDIAELVAYAHLFGARIYVTLNTLLYDDELPAVQALIHELAAVHVDALITQDPRIISGTEGAPGQSISSPIPLHASTQMDNRTIDDVRARAEGGYEQTVLARELSLDEIRAIHDAVPEMALEAFVHGALCVSYSGRCYASEYCFGRSANRGECAQFCRLPFDLIDADGQVVSAPANAPASRLGNAPDGFPVGKPLRQRHLLSLKDLNRSRDLEAMMDAGISSFKIEGRLKDVSYVKNITAYYRQQLDAILARRPQDFCRASYGASTLSFRPNPLKSFNRGFTDYFLHGRTADMANFATPKSLGEPVGSVKELHPASLSVAGTATFSNGDGLCFFASDGHLQGFRVNRIDQQGRLYPADPSVLTFLRKGTALYRNLDAAFERVLSRPTADRCIPVRWLLEDVPLPAVPSPPGEIPLPAAVPSPSGEPPLPAAVPSPSGEVSPPLPAFRLTLTTESGRTASRTFPYPHELARTPQTDNLRRQLLRLGDTPYTCTEADIDIRFTDNWFLPASVLGEWRRMVVSDLRFKPSVRTAQGGVKTEDLKPRPAALMTCRYCLRHALGYCTRDGRRLPVREPLSLRLADGRTFPLHFDCRRCEMQVLKD
ncbi:MAG: DUF3656 domain-containing protein [Bacteroidaceae bacterium]|nr:DUF3656 domain-containing protein [Bacteroidaceae bacterium]